MESIWLEEDNSAKLTINNPLVATINSNKPLLLNKRNIELPPLPPSSYFSSQAVPASQKESRGGKSEYKKHKKDNILISAFKKLSVDYHQYQQQVQEQQQPARKTFNKRISTPFDFSHIQHMDSGLNQLEEEEQEEEEQEEEKQQETTEDEPEQDKKTLDPQDKSKMFCTSPMLKQSKRTLSIASASTNTSSIFTRSNSIATQSTRKRSMIDNSFKYPDLENDVTYSNLIQSINNFTQNLPEPNEEDEFDDQERMSDTIASLRAAKYSRISRRYSSSFELAVSEINIDFDRSFDLASSQTASPVLPPPI